MTSALRLALVVSSALTFVSPALAQEASDTPDAADVPAAESGDEDAGDIVVTARRVEERLQDVPISITVYNQEQLSNRNIVSGNDLATYTPSLSANSRFGAETASFAIRGFVQENFTSPSVATYFADVTGPRTQGGTAAGNGAGPGQLFDLQNVQVLKGPQGTLFGRNTTGGAVLLVPQKPKDDLGGYVEASYGNYDMYHLQGVLNVPLADTFKVRLGVDRMKRDGYLKNLSGIGTKAFNEVDYLSLRLGILAELTPTLENYTIARYIKSDTSGTSGRMIAANAAGCRDGIDPVRFPNLPGTGFAAPGARAAPTSAFLAPIACSQQLARARTRGDGYWETESSHPNPMLESEHWSIINTTTWEASDTITLKNIASYQQFRQRAAFNIGSDNYVMPATTTPFGGPNQFAGLPFTWVGLYPDPTFDNVNQYTMTEEFQIQGRTTDGRLNYVLGAYYEKSDPGSLFQGSLSQISYTASIPAGPTASFPVLATLSCTNIQAYQCRPIDTAGLGVLPGLVQNSLTRYWFENIGFFGQGTYDITEQLAVTGGIRYTIDKVRGEGGTRSIFFSAPNTFTATCAAFAGRPANSGEDCITQINQKSKKPTWVLGVDFKPTDDTLLYAKYSRGYRQGNVNASNTVPVSWGPEKVDTYEVGAKASFRGALRGYFNVAAFYNDFTAQQLSANLIPDGTVANASPAQAIVNGGKSRIQGVELDFSANYGMFGLSGGYTYLDTLLKSYTPPIFAGYLPPTTGALVGGALPLSPKHKLTLTPSVTLPFDDSLGEMTLSATYVHTSKQVAQADSPFGILPSYDLLNLNLNWDSVAGSPIDLGLFGTNVLNEKYPVFVGGSWNSTGTESLIVGQPRMYGIRVRYRFGGDAD